MVEPQNGAGAEEQLNPAFFGFENGAVLQAREAAEFLLEFIAVDENGSFGVVNYSGVDRNDRLCGGAGYQEAEERGQRTQESHIDPYSRSMDPIRTLVNR